MQKSLIGLSGVYSVRYSLFSKISNSINAICYFSKSWNNFYKLQWVLKNAAREPVPRLYPRNFDKNVHKEVVKYQSFSSHLITIYQSLSVFLLKMPNFKKTSFQIENFTIENFNSYFRENSNLFYNFTIFLSFEILFYFLEHFRKLKKNYNEKLLESQQEIDKFRNNFYK